MKNILIFVLILLVTGQAFATRRTLVAKRINYTMSHEWDEHGGKNIHNRRVLDSTYKSLIIKQSQFIKVDSIKWDSLRNANFENKDYIFVDEISIVDHHGYWEVFLVLDGESTKLPFFEAYWDFDTFVIHNFDKIRQKVVEKKEVSLEEEKKEVAPVYTPKWTPKFIKEQDKKKRKKN